ISGRWFSCLLARRRDDSGRDRGGDLRAQGIAGKKIAGFPRRSAFRTSCDRRHRIDGGGKVDGRRREFDLPPGKAGRLVRRTLRPEPNGAHEARRTRSGALTWRIRIERFRGKTLVLRLLTL